MTDEQIKEVLIGTQKYMLDQLPISGDEHNFSRQFRIKIEKLFKKAKHPILYGVIKAVGGFFLGMIVLSSAILCINAEARAQVVNWFMERVSNNEFRYHNGSNYSYDNSDMGDFEKYTFVEIVPSEYHLLTRNQVDYRFDEIFTDEMGNLLYVTVMKAGYSAELHILSDENAPNGMVDLGNYKADMYLSNEPENPSAITWQNEAGTLFSIQGVLDKETLISLAKQIAD